jgi:hypothetical protein
MTRPRWLVLLSLSSLAFAQQPPSGCKVVTFWGDTGCETSAQGECAKSYHKQLACPKNPMIKAPCHYLCVADAAKKNASEKPAHEAGDAAHEAAHEKDEPI